MVIPTFALLQNNNDPTSKLFQLIITDYCIPRLSGVEILTKAKLFYGIAAKPQPKVIMLSALEDHRLMLVLNEQKLVDKFFNKPV